MRPYWYEGFVGLRYLRASPKRGSVSLIAGIAIFGLSLGVAVLIVVLSVMNGFQKELRARILGVASHVQISGADGRLANWQAVARAASADPDVLAAAPYISAQGLLANQQNVQGALVRGVVPELEDQVADIGSHMRRGSLTDLKPGQFGMVLGVELAHAVGARVGEKVVLITPQGQVTPAGILPRIKQFTVVGVFEVGMYEYDAGLALVSLEDAQKLYRLGDEVSGVRLKLKDLFRAPEVARDLTSALPGDLYISDWTRSHANFFRAVQIEKNLVMAVTDKQPDIAILRTLGATPISIMKIFVVQGSLIGVIGTVIGVVGGILIALNVDVVVPAIERLFRVQFLAKDVYYISELPSDLLLRDVVTVGVMSLLLSLFATLYPSWRASRVNPAEALRYE
jgi:lipoprotein-releasing system permease protein